MKIVIQKFGGTSVSTKENRKKVVEKVKMAIERGYSPVVVVSAMGRKGSPYATDTLLSLVGADFIKENKLAADFLISCGEDISAVVISNDLWKEKIDCMPLGGGQAGLITDSVFSSATVIKTEADKIMNILSQGKVPVITGFQGKTEEGYITTLGRGGSDTSAAILGVMLQADRIEIYTDVDGIMTADPRIVKEANVINVISYEEVFQLADQGAKVIHPKAVEYAKEGHIPLLIKNTLNNNDGTLINCGGDKKNNKLITSITSTSNRVQLTLNYEENKNNDKYGDVLEIIAANRVSVDLINIFPSQQIFTVEKDEVEVVIDIFQKLNLKYHAIYDCSKVALVGNGMKGTPGVMAKIFKGLNKENIDVLQTADSHMTIWCLVRDKDVLRAINTLHKIFYL